MATAPTPRPATPTPSTFGSQPTSRAGRGARVATLVLLGVFFLASALTGIFGRRESGSTADDVLQFTGPVLGVILVTAGLASLLLALRALISHRERSFVVWAALGFGVLAALFLLGELLLPH